VGKVRKNSNKTAIFRVDNIQELQVIIDHFNKYPLISAKVPDFLLFEQCFSLIKQKQHLTQAGLEQIVALRYYLNKGESDVLKEAFPNIVPVDRPKYVFNGIPNPFWISGFVSGDSTFCVSIQKGYNKIGNRVRLIFGTCLHIRDKELLISIRNYFYNLASASQEVSFFYFESGARGRENKSGARGRENIFMILKSKEIVNFKLKTILIL
jgi:LAGLIDADG endonuclease